MSTALVERMRKVGIDAHSYARSPGAKEAFILGINPSYKAGRLYVWEGNAKVEAATDKTFRQAVLNVEEQERVFSRWMEVAPGDRELLTDYSDGPPRGRWSEWRPYSDVEMQDAGLSRFKRNWYLPADTTYEVIDFQRPATLHSDSKVRVRVQATSPASKLSVLTGMDETAHFVAQLPTFGVGSVAEAHEVLRPTKAEKPGTVRQGEWFFVPVTDQDLIMSLMRHVSQQNGGLWTMPLESSSSHFAFTVDYGGTKYAIGVVQDNRTGRHHDLVLAGWHEVVRNREVAVMPDQNQPRARYWD